MLPPSGKELPVIVRRNRRSATKPKWLKAASGPGGSKGVRCRGARGKTIVFGLFGRNGRVYAEITPDCPKTALQGIIRGHVEPENIIHSDGRRGYEGMVDSGCRKRFRVEHGDNEFAGRRSRVNGFESPWAFAKTRSGFRGIHRHMFCFHLKECEFRVDHRQEDIRQMFLKMSREPPLSQSLPLL